MQIGSSDGKIGYSSSVEFSPNDILYMLKDLPDACCIFKVLTDPFGTVKDMLFLFVNEKYAQLTGRHSAELIGTTFYSSVTNQDEDWIKFSYQAAILRQSSINRTYNSTFDKWFEFWAVPVFQKGFCAFIIHDVTADKRDEDVRQFQTNTNNLVIECAKAASTPDFNRGIKRVLRKIGQTIEADRVYVIRNEGDKIKERYDWFSKTCPAELPSKKVFEKYELISIWTNLLQGKSFFYMNDVSIAAEKYPELYSEYLAGKCSRFAVVELKDKDGHIGFLVADNYPLELNVNIAEVMETVAAFITYQIRNHELTEELMYLGGHDALTGLGNRYALNQDTNILSKTSCPVGVCYTDINGLKAINDEKGHEAGDRIITDTANSFSSVFKKKNCYRIGGDEFVAVVPDVEKEKFMELVEKFRSKAKDVAIAVGYEWSEHSTDIKSVIKKADEAMYRNKAQYYRNHERRHANNI
jgi:diguanylate cyclase (GGDEF)-like protein